MHRPTPIVVRLPLAFARGRLSMAQLLARAVRGEVRVAAFALRRREHRFVKHLLRTHPRFWIYRTDQRALAGDFALVDMSAPRPANRRLWIVDLKLGAPITLGGGGAGNQLSRHTDAVDALVQTGVVGPVRPKLAVGDGMRLVDVVAASPQWGADSSRGG